MKRLFQSILLSIVFTLSLQGQITGFNWGQVHHSLQLQYQQNGYAPKQFIDWIQSEFPKEMVQHVRFSGTMSNTMALNVPGYGHAPHDQQVKNQRKAQPAESYIYPFLDLYRKLNAQSLSFTINTHKPFQGTQQDLDLMWEAVSLIYNNTNVIAWELENESYYYYSITGSAGGTPNMAEKTSLAGGFIQGRNSKNVEAGMLAKINSYLDFLELKIVPELKDRYPGIPIGISIGNATNMRERIWNQAVLARNFYDFLIPHIYLDVEDPRKMEAEIKSRLDQAKVKDVPIHVTEFNWNYEKSKKGPANPDAFRKNFFQILSKYGVRNMYFHTMSMGTSPYSWKVK